MKNPKKGYKIVKWMFGKEIEIPQEWRIDKLSSSCKKTKDIVAGPFGSNLVVSDYVDEGVPIIRLQNIERNTFIKKNIKFISNTKSEELDYHSYVPSDLVLAKLGDPIGKTCKIPGNFPNGIVVADVVRIRIDIKKSSQKFIEYILNSKLCEIQHNKEKIGTTRPRVNLEQIRNLKFPIPPLPEQTHIASILSGVDALIESTQDVVDKTERLKSGLMQQLLTRGIGHAKFKKVTFGRHFIDYKIPKEWKLSTLCIVATVHGRIGWKNLRSDEYVESGFLMLSVWSLVDTSSYGVDFTQGVKRLNQFRYDESPEIQLRNGDVLVAKDGDIGRIGFIKKLQEPTTVNSHVVTVRVNKELLNSEFLYWFFKSKPFQTYCKAFTSGTTVPLFTQKDLRNSIIPLTSIPEQAKIASILSGVDAYIQKNRECKEKLEILKRGLMQKLLTGQIRV